MGGMEGDDTNFHEREGTRRMMRGLMREMTKVRSEAVRPTVKTAAVTAITDMSVQATTRSHPEGSIRWTPEVRRTEMATTMRMGRMT